MRASLVAPLCIPLLLLSFSTAPAAAQERKEPTRVWGSLMLGLGGWDQMGDQHTNAALAYALQATGQRGAGVVTARMSGTAAPFAGGVWDLGLLYGRALERGTWHFSASAGLAYVRWWDDGFLWDEAEDIRSTIGLPLAGEVVWLPGRHVGIGLQAFGNLNPEASFAAAGVVLRIGNLRPDKDVSFAQRSPFASR